MTKDEIKAKAEMLLKNSRETQGEFVQVYNNGFEDGVNFVLQNLQQCNVSGTLAKQEVLKELLDYIDSFHGSGHDYWWINSKIREKVYWMLERSKANDR